ncbi:hypothetical protein pb186bvf_004140 [Paramecium bursaria]
MARQVQKLTLDDKQKNEIQKEIFVTIRLIDMVEKCAQLSDDKIAPEKYDSEIRKLLEKLENLLSKIPNMTAIQFAKEYNLEDCKFGLDRIKLGPPKKQGTQIQLVKELSQMFHRIQDQIFMANDIIKVATFRPLVQKLIELIERTERELPKYDSYLIQLKQFNDKAFNRELMDTLTEMEVQEFSTLIDTAMQAFMGAQY